MHPLDRIAKDLTYEYFGNSLAVGRYFIYREKPIKIIDGFFLDPVYGRLSNHWEWRRVLPDGTLGRRGSGYGGDAKIFRPITEKQAIELAKKL